MAKTYTPILTSMDIGASLSDTPTATALTASSTVSGTATSVALEIFGLDINDPLAPTALQTDGQTNPTILTVSAITYTPLFDAIYNDPDVADIANKFQIQVSTDPTFTDVTHWDSGILGTLMTDVVEGDRSSDLTYDGSALSFSTTYYWRVRFWDDEGNVGLWSSETSSFILDPITAKIKLLGRAKLLGNTKLL